MWADLFHYAQVVGLRWFLIVAIAVISVADVTKKLFPTWTEWADAHWFTPPRRRFVEITALVGAVLWAGFSAWEDEHTARLTATFNQEKAARDAAYWKGRATVAIPAPTPQGRNATKPNKTQGVELRPTPIPSPQVSNPGPLKRLIAYDLPTLNTTGNKSGDGTDWVLNSASIWVRNVSADTINCRVNYFNIYIDGIRAMKTKQADGYFITQQTQSMLYQARPTGAMPIIAVDAKVIRVEFEVEYDTIPSSGRRMSRRVINYPIEWPNGRKDQPQFQPRVIDQSEQ